MTQSTWQQLITLKDELIVQSHLLSLDLQDQLDELVKSMRELEASALHHAQQLGKQEAHHYIGSEEEIQQLIEQLGSIQQAHLRRDDE